MKKILLLALAFVLILSCFALFSSCDQKDNIPEDVEVTEGLKFKSVKGGYELTEVTDKSITELIIPDTYKNKPVVSIGVRACADLKNLYRAAIPCTVEVIKKEAFSNCQNLYTIYIGYSIKGDSVDVENSKPSLNFIQALAFNLSYNLCEIYYNGTMDEFISMSKDVNAADSDWNRNTADVLSIICLDGRVEYRWGVDNKPTKYPNASQGLEYTLNSDGKSYSVTGIGTCTDKNLIIPSTYNGKPVTEIAESAFYNEYQAGNSILGTSEYSKYTFTSVTIPSSVTKINEFAFYNCRLITKIVLSDGVTTIGDHAFVFCGITKIDIPKSVVNLGKGVFGSCDLLEEIAVDVNNPKYKSIDGNLYSADGQILVMYASGKSQNSFTIPSHVKTVGYHSFTYCNNLVEIVIPNTVTIIDDYAIVDCNYLANLYIGNGVKTLGVGIIYSLYTNVKITYSGSIDEWKKIEKRTDEFGYDWNSFLQIPAIYCSNGVYYVE